ncbi:MAG: hypothetical protein RL455_313, partial [Actinomycetota bacterium]
MKNFISNLREKALLPFLAFIFAFFIGGILIVLSSPDVMGLIKSPGKF